MITAVSKRHKATKRSENVWENDKKNPRNNAKDSIILREMGHLYSATWPNHSNVKGHWLAPQRKKDECDTRTCHRLCKSTPSYLL